MSIVVRPARLEDRAAVREIAVESGLFGDDDVALVLDSFDADDHLSESSLWRVAEDHHQLQGVVYCVPEAAGDQVWNVLFLAVRPRAQRRGIASLLLDEIETALFGTSRARLLLVETSTAPSQEAARRFYRRHGFTQVAEIPDYYAEGDSKVVFTRR
jgi:ribosomal protein S18 acetylase RimI-like enzyme